MMRALLVACCLVGLVLGGAFAPAVGIQTPVPEIGDDEGGSVGGPSDDAEEADDAVDGETDGEGGETEADEPPDGNSGADSYGGVSAGGYPEETTIGGELRLSDHPELLINAPEQSRWRLGAYATYTGSGFARDGPEREPVTGEIGTATDDRPSPEYDIFVRPQRPMNALATVWRPAFADAENHELFVSEGRALTVEEPIEPGEAYVTVTYGPPSRDAAAERSGQGSPPAEIERRYTQLPEETPQRLTAKTRSIADDADAETPFETAQAVDAWLKTNKAYSLNATHDRSNDVADEFVFEMDAGYCQYFATAMTAMLRTQGIPARYVTGYGGGERVDGGEYLVRGKHAHAWVEVYVADVGWVTFDPTPAGGRLDADRDEASVDDLGDTPEEAEDEGAENGADAPEEAADEADVTDSVDVTLTPDPVPGRDVTVTVTHESSPVSGATVRFNGEPVGETDASGNVTAEVPYDSTLEIEVLIDGDLSQLDTADGSTGQSLSDSLRTLDSRPDSELSGTATREAPPPTQLESQNATFSFDVPTEITIEPTDEPVAGSPVGIEATIDDEPVRDGEVSLDGESVARTDDDGLTTVELPDADAVSVVVERDGARGNRTLNLTRPTLDLSVEPSLLVALPGTAATVEVTHEGSPVSNATVALEGDVIGETASDGTADVSLPLADSATLTATATIEDQRATATTTLDGMYRRLAGVAGAAFVGLLALVVTGYRRGVTPRGIVGSLGAILTSVGRVLVAVVVAFGQTLEAAVETVRRLAKRAVELLGGGVEGAIALFGAIKAGAASAVRRSAAALRALPGRLHPYAVLAFLNSLRRSAAESVTNARGGSSGSDGTAAAEERLTVQEAWSEFRRYVTVRSWRTSTPGEVSRWAVKKDGLPAGAVRTLRDAFRAVEYGDRPPDSHAPEAESAIEEIRTSRRDEEEADGS